ncbi:LytR/AlgR family response regulator transcription factor [Tenacibaculum soleae]|uniref:DNA-binding response regulator n=1 Tax=Tenacibaculum soleae TaxID=447689 RepID=A0A1B9Y0Y1_9FLAO|nr:LytTR family DNA-binding domain-containing protein [Tenacibaculum soleae]MDO6811598.1 LytTR family DNA-binding domain-containing protein [Tenacibaculum soleae]OCK43478.1 DNA-binding response regulator [Tenacibaculum soleae]
MKKYKCLIVDDEELARELIATHLNQLPDFEIVAVCASAIEASSVLKTELVDLMFLDIEMPVLKGIEFLKNLANKPKVIFTTAHREYAIESYELNVVDYLLKPIVFTRFFKAIEKFLDTQTVEKPANKKEEATHMFVQSNKKNIKVLFEDILYIESIKDYIRIHTLAAKLVIKHGISAFEEKLDNRFIRVHRSYIVNSQKVTAYTKQDIEISKIEIPIGDLYKKNALERLKL